MPASSPTSGDDSLPFGPSQRLPRPTDQRQRRQQNRTDSSNASGQRSASLEQMLQDTNNVSRLMDEEITRRVSDQLQAQRINMPGDSIGVLQRMLSVCTVVSTSSSFANEQQSAVGQHLGYRKIGFGLTGVVFELPGTLSVVKVARNPNHLGHMLWNNFVMQHKVYGAFKSAGEDEVRIPRPFAYVNAALDDKCKAWWRDNQERFPPDLQMSIPSDLIDMERIFPLPKNVRTALIDIFCPEPLKSQAMNDPANRDCLLRVYLGKRELEQNVNARRMFTLRNFNLHLSRIERIQVNPTNWAIQMGRVLAILHWEAGVDGHDVEFVLGSSSMREKQILTYDEVAKLPPRSGTIKMQTNFKRRIIDMWLLDFNNVTMPRGTEDDIDRMVWAFYWNDPYYPLPEAALEKDRELWNAFSREYLAKSAKILAASPQKRALPKLFIDACIEREKINIKEGLGHGWREQRD